MNRRFRLRKSSDLQRVRRTGQSFAHPLLVLQAARNVERTSRIGVIATRSIGTAVDRNRAKRLIREAIRGYLPYILIGWDLILIARKPLLKADFVVIREAVGKLLNKAEVMNDKHGETGS